MRHFEKALFAALMLSSVASARTAVGQALPIETIPYVLSSYNPGDGDNLSSSNLLVDHEGNLYGTTVDGGLVAGNQVGFGRVFELSPVVGGGWTEKTIYIFNGYKTDGSGPSGNLTWDEKGNIYGTTQGGGAYNNGTAYELSPASDGTWTERVIYSFPTQTNPYFPGGGLVFDTHGSLFGVTPYGGSPNDGGCSTFGGCGMVYELSPSADGQWTGKFIYEFGASSADLIYPQPYLVIDSNGNLYGTAFNSGYPSKPTGVFELTQQSDGNWTETIIHRFGRISTDGQFPNGNLLLDRQGNLYGVTAGGGPSTAGYPGGGTVFELEPQSDGNWTEKQLFVFPDYSTAPVPTGLFGFNPNEGLTMDAAGNLYGTTEAGGISTGPFNQGTVFELEPHPDGIWTARLLHSFPANQTDGYLTNSQVAFDAHGNLFGTTLFTEEPSNNHYGLGAVYELAAVGPSSAAGTKTSLFLNQSGETLHVNEPITLTASINADTSLVVIPTGAVTFTDSTGVSVVVPLVAGRAVYSLTVPATCMYSVSASYSGDIGFAPSKSDTISRMVIPRFENCTFPSYLGAASPATR